MQQQVRASSSSLSSFGADAANQVAEFKPKKFEDGGLKGVDGADMEKWIESRRAELEDGSDLTDDDRLYLACQYMEDQGMSPDQPRFKHNIAVLFFYPDDLESLDYTRAGGATAVSTKGETMTATPFQAYGGKDTNRRNFLTEVVREGNRLGADDEIYVGMPGSFAFTSRRAIFADFQQLNPGATWGSDAHNNYVLRLVYAHQVAVTSSIADMLPPIDKSVPPSVYMTTVIGLVAGAAIDPVYKRACADNSELTLEDEAMITDILEDFYGIRCNLNSDAPMSTTDVDWIDPPQTDSGFTPPKTDPDPLAAHGEMVFRLNKELERIERWAADPSGTYHLDGPPRNWAGDETWSRVGLQDDLSLTPGAQDQGVSVQAYKGWLQAWLEVEQWKSEGPRAPGEDATEEDVADYEAFKQAHDVETAKLEAAMFNAGEGLRMATGGMEFPDGCDGYEQDELDAAATELGDMLNVVDSSRKNAPAGKVHLESMQKQATGILAGMWAELGLGSGTVDCDDAAAVVRAWQGWLDAYRQELGPQAISAAKDLALKAVAMLTPG